MGISMMVTFGGVIYLGLGPIVICTPWCQLVAGNLADFPAKSGHCYLCLLVFALPETGVLICRATKSPLEVGRRSRQCFIFFELVGVHASISLMNLFLVKYFWLNNMCMCMYVCVYIYIYVCVCLFISLSLFCKNAYTRTDTYFIFLTMQLTHMHTHAHTHT